MNFKDFDVFLIDTFLMAYFRQRIELDLIEIQQKGNFHRKSLILN